jgi:addiction module RelE/StbE family toxin
VSRRPVRVIWSSQAVQELQEILEYIRRDSPQAADRIRQEIRNGTRRLARFPLSGRLLPEFPDSGLRELIVRSYRIIYDPAADQVEILTVVHGSRDLPSLPPFG